MIPVVYGVLRGYGENKTRVLRVIVMENEISVAAEKDDHDVIYTLRTVHQTQSQLVLLADQKANILIGIVAIIFTILFTKSDLLTGIEGGLLISFICFFVLEVLAMFLALIVILPKNINKQHSVKLKDVSNPLFFGVFTNYSESEYVEFLTGKMNDNKSARELLATDLYQIGVVLKKKYSLLKYAYYFAVIGVVSLLFIILYS